MIPAMSITAWSRTAPWAEQRQVEQELIISRAIVELFSDKFLAAELRFRGGTALNKLHFPEPLRYSEDIDLVRNTKGPIKPVLRRVREVLEPWLDEAAFEQSRLAEPDLPHRRGGRRPVAASEGRDRRLGDRNLRRVGACRLRRGQSMDLGPSGDTDL